MCCTSVFLFKPLYCGGNYSTALLRTLLLYVLSIESANTWISTPYCSWARIENTPLIRKDNCYRLDECAVRPCDVTQLFPRCLYVRNPSFSLKLWPAAGPNLPPGSVCHRTINPIGQPLFYVKLWPAAWPSLSQDSTFSSEDHGLSQGQCYRRGTVCRRTRSAIGEPLCFQESWPAAGPRSPQASIRRRIWSPVG